MFIDRHGIQCAHLTNHIEASFDARALSLHDMDLLGQKSHFWVGLSVADASSKKGVVVIMSEI